MTQSAVTASGTKRDVPIVPDPRVTYGPVSKTGSSYTVPAAKS